MKEFGAQQGGRYTYADDLLNLQELALSFSSIFNDCDNFIISGCEVSGRTISAGYVYLNGKIRRFSGASGVSSWPQYIYEQNSTETVAYASGADKVGRYVYGCALASTIPTALDPTTNQVPTGIQITSSGGLRMREALFGKYALLLQTTKASQTVNGKVVYSGDVDVSGILSANGDLKVSKGTGVAQIIYDGTDFVIKSRINTGKAYEMRIVDNSGLQFIIDNTVVGSLTENGFVSSMPISVSGGLLGEVMTISDHIYNSGQSSNTASLNINIKGYNGGNTHYRNTYIGNGKGVAVLSIIGSTGEMIGNGTMSLVSSSVNGMTLKSTLAKSNVALRKILLWADTNNETMASIGFNSTTTSIFEIKNTIADINVIGLTAVNIGPAIKENGILLSDKYLSIASFNTAHAQKANATDVYSKTDADNTFSKKSNGLSQFVTNTNTQAVLRQHIGALGASDVTNVYARIDQLLADIATTDERKRTIRNNIGAAGVGDFQPVLSDTGWIAISGTSLYARQIGNIVSVQGKVTTRHQGTVFTLPNQISAPIHNVSFSAPNKKWGGYIDGNTKTFIATCRGDHGDIISFSLTYMV